MLAPSLRPALVSSAAKPSASSGAARKEAPPASLLRLRVPLAKDALLAVRRLGGLATLLARAASLQMDVLAKVPAGRLAASCASRLRPRGLRRSPNPGEALFSIGVKQMSKEKRS
eukprot:6190028-Pleurochrysis_carterae.AAC.3